MKLGKEETGFITNKRLLNSLPQKNDLNIFEEVKKKYPVGSSHTCRILDYNRMEEMYICTFEPKCIKEKVFAVKDLGVGQNVAGKVSKIVPTGLVVAVGNIQGFVPNLHVSSVKYTHNIKAKYTEGMPVKAK